MNIVVVETRSSLPPNVLLTRPIHHPPPASAKEASKQFATAYLPPQTSQNQTMHRDDAYQPNRGTPLTPDAQHTQNPPNPARLRPTHAFACLPSFLPSFLPSHRPTPVTDSRYDKRKLRSAGEMGVPLPRRDVAALPAATGAGSLPPPEAKDATRERGALPAWV